MIDREKWREQERVLNILVKTLKKNMLLSDLIELDGKHKGILIKFWRTNGNQPSFVEWIDTMQKKEAKAPQKIEERSSVIDEPQPVEVEIEEEVEVEESDVERIERKLKEIQEKYS